MKEEKTNNTQNNNVPIPAPSIELNSNPTEVVVVNTEKKKTNNIIIYIFAVLLLLCVVFMNNIIDFVNDNFSSKSPTQVVETKGNLVNEMLPLNDQTSYIIIEKVKFFNAKINTGKLLVSYSSSEKQENIKEKNILFQLYNNDFELLYSVIFDIDTIEENTTKVYNLALEQDVFNEASYLKVSVKTQEPQETLSCSISETDDCYSYLKNVTYYFEDGILKSYIVNSSSSENTANTNTSKNVCINKLEEEYQNVLNYIKDASYENNILRYNVNVENPNGLEITIKDGISRYRLSKQLEEEKWKCK